MSPGQLLKQLESLGLIDPEILAKIRKEVENPEKSVKPQAVLSYLIKKKQITEAQAKMILKGAKAPKETQPESASKPQPPTVDPTPDEKEYDVDDLTSFLQDPEPEPPKSKPVPPVDATVMDEGQFADLAEEIVEVEPVEVEPLMAEPLDVGQQDMLADADMIEPYNDGFGDSTGGGAVPESEGSTATFSFAGKKDLRDQWATKWLYIGFGILGCLLIAGAVLFIATMGVKAEDQFKAAMDSFEKLAYQDAASKFEAYIEANPKHKYVPTAKARWVQCMLATTYSARNWTETITRAETLLPPLVDAEDSKLEIIRDDLALMLPDSLLHVTDKGRKATELAELEKELATALEYKKVIDNNVYIPTSQRNKPGTAANLAKIDNNIRIIEGQINKEKDYNRAIVEIKKLGEAGQTDNAFATYTKLTRNYGDLAGREELRNTMAEISLKERELVKPAETNLNVANAARPSPIQSTVLLASKNGSPMANLKGEVVNFLAEGSVYGIDAGDGTLLWRRFVGFETGIKPQSLDQDSLLVADQLRNDLMRLKKLTGEIVWRAEIDEPFLTPAFTDGPIVVTTRSGKVIQFSRDSGKPEQTAQLPQSANVPALIAERDPYIYQIGLYSNLYVLSSQDMSCKEVYYLGHYKGSIAVPPQTWTGYILVAVNGGDYCDLHILKPTQNGLNLELVQVITRVTSGPVSTPLQRFGRWMLVTADNGEIRILELLPSDERNPVRKFASDRFDNSSGQPAYVLTEGSNLWIAGLGISRFRIQRTQGTFQRDEIIDHSDTFLTPLAKLDENIFHVSRRYGSGMLSASLVDAKSLAPVWRTDFGGQVVGTPQLAGDALLAVSNQGDLFRIGQGEIEKQYVEATAKASQIVEDLKFTSLVPLADATFACLGPPTQEDFLFVRSSIARSKLMRLSPPANHPACRPLAIEHQLIVPSLDGQVTRIDPTKGYMVGTPFQPPISPGTETEWFEPTLIREALLAIACGNGADDQNQSTLYLLDAKNSKSITEVGSLDGKDPFKSRLVNDGNSVFGVVESGNNDSLVTVSISPQLEISNKVKLPGRVVAGPWLVDSGILVKMDNDQLLHLAKDLSMKWPLSIANDQFAGPPESIDSRIMLSFRSGKILIVDPGGGKIIQEHDLGQPITDAPARVGSTTFFSGLDGTIHLVDLNKLSEAN